jgi:hypothetical protein
VAACHRLLPAVVARHCSSSTNRYSFFVRHRIETKWQSRGKEMTVGGVVTTESCCLPYASVAAHWLIVLCRAMRSLVVIRRPPSRTVCSPSSTALRRGTKMGGKTYLRCCLTPIVNDLLPSVVSLLISQTVFDHHRLLLSIASADIS